MLDKHHKIKKIKSFGLLAAFLLSAAFAIAVIQPQIVEAGGRADPKCLSNHTYKYITCSDVPANLFPGGQGPQPDKCYLIGVIFTGNAGGVSVQERTCNELDQLYYDNSASIEADCKGDTLNEENCGIVRYLVRFINALSGVVGLVIVSMIIVGGIQYSSAGDDPQKVSAAKTKITNALLALLVFIFMFAFLQWVVPGGIF